MIRAHSPHGQTAWSKWLCLSRCIWPSFAQPFGWHRQAFQPCTVGISANPGSVPGQPSRSRPWRSHRQHLAPWGPESNHALTPPHTGTYTNRNQWNRAVDDFSQFQDNGGWDEYKIIQNNTRMQRRANGKRGLSVWTASKLPSGAKRICIIFLRTWTVGVHPLSVWVQWLEAT